MVFSVYTCSMVSMGYRKGKASIHCQVCKLQAQLGLKRLVSFFNRVTARPHRPRSAAIRRLMVVAGIPVPARPSGTPADGRDDSDIEGEGEEEELEDDDIVVDPADPVSPPASAPLLDAVQPITDKPEGEGSSDVAMAGEPIQPIRDSKANEELVAIARPAKLRRTKHLKTASCFK